MANRKLERREKRTLGVLAISGIVGAFAFSSAYFSSQDTTDFAQLQAGTIVIDSTSPASWTGDYGTLLPGAVITSDINVKNDGTAALAYAISGEASDDTVGLDAALGLKIYEGTCPGDGDFGGATLLIGGLTFADLEGGSVLVGDPDPYADPGDRYLAAGDDEDLCVRAQFTNSGSEQNALQGATADLTLTFDATQIDANGSVASPAP